MTGVYHRNVKSTNGIVEYSGGLILLGEFLVRISTRRPIILTVVLIIQENVEIYSTPDHTVRNFTRSFMHCVICSVCKDIWSDK
jgi:hypothetical protein